MTLRLILMRHAKSDWSLSGDDHDRPLNPRGLRSARALGQWLRDHDYLPDTALVSSAVRTRQTFDLLGLAVAPSLDRGLYLADENALLRALQDSAGKTVLMIGHNPGIASFATDVLTEPHSHERFFDYPTGATLVAEFEAASWNDVQLGTGVCRDFIVPRDL
jgi:phosphohistidine phosphatase